MLKTPDAAEKGNTQGAKRVYLPSQRKKRLIRRLSACSPTEAAEKLNVR